MEYFPPAQSAQIRQQIWSIIDMVNKRAPKKSERVVSDACLSKQVCAYFTVPQPVKTLGQECCRQFVRGRRLYCRPCQKGLVEYIYCVLTMRFSHLTKEEFKQRRHLLLNTCRGLGCCHVSDESNKLFCVHHTCEKCIGYFRYNDVIIGLMAVRRYLPRDIVSYCIAPQLVRHYFCYQFRARIHISSQYSSTPSAIYHTCDPSPCSYDPSSSIKVDRHNLGLYVYRLHGPHTSHSLCKVMCPDGGVNCLNKVSWNVSRPTINSHVKHLALFMSNDV
jgi:hypothetical protein